MTTENIDYASFTLTTLLAMDATELADRQTVRRSAAAQLQCGMRQLRLRAAGVQLLQESTVKVCSVIGFRWAPA